MIYYIFEKIRLFIVNKIYSKSEKFIKKFNILNKEIIPVFYLTLYSLLFILNHEYFHNNSFIMLYLMLNMFSPYESNFDNKFNSNKVFNFIIREFYCLFKLISFIIFMINGYILYTSIKLIHKEYTNKQILIMNRKKK